MRASGDHCNKSWWHVSTGPNTTPHRGAEQVNIAEFRSTSFELWHRKLEHLNKKNINLLKGMVTSMNISGRNNEPCIPCIHGKQSRKTFLKNGAKRTNNVLQLVHSEVCGPMSNTSYGGARHLLTLTDDFSRNTFGYLFK
jgi:hypothetical protein